MKNKDDLDPLKDPGSIPRVCACGGVRGCVCGGGECLCSDRCVCVMVSVHVLVVVFVRW